MRAWRPYLVAAACLSLLGMQLGGLHVHAGADGFDATLHGTHVHDGAARGHSHSASGRPPADAGTDAHAHPSGADSDHSGSRDVSLVDLVGGKSSLPVFLVFLTAFLLPSLPLERFPRWRSFVPLPKSRRDRWRPPLRAPPLHAS